MKRLILIAVMALVAAPVVLAEPAGRGGTEQQIQRLEVEGREATLKNDLEATDRLLAENWVNINPDGSLTTKAKLLDFLRAGSFKFLSIENDDVLVRAFGDAAVVTGRSTSKRTGEGDEVITRQVRFTRVYAKQKGRWQVVSAHNTLLIQP